MNPYTALTEDVTGATFRAGNTFEILQNGDEIFPAMLTAIRGANHRIEFLSYLFWRSQIATEFAQALAERARAGVQVRLLIDAVGGASMSSRLIWQMERAGVRVHWFRPGYMRHLRYLNNRTHRKILIVDGHTGFTGGVGIADIWLGNAQDPKHWRETHCQLTGPAVADLFTGFAENWQEATHERLTPFKLPVEAGPIAIHTAISTARDRPTTMARLFDAVFAAARERLWITTAYFVPSEAIVGALAAAAQRGVDVRVLCNGRLTDHRLTWLAGRATYQRLLDAGVKLYEYQKTMHHAKIVTADRTWATLGSTNLDPRSLVLNDELNVSVVDPRLVTALDRQYEADLASAQAILTGTWSRRSRLDRIIEAGSSIFRHQL